MEKNYYEILGLEEEEIIYFLNQYDEIDQTPEAEKMRDEIIKSAYEKRKTEIEEEYKRDLNSVEQQFDLKNKIIEYGRRKNANNDLNKERIKNGFENNKEEYSEKVRKIKEKYELNIKALELAFEQLKSEDARKTYNELLANRPNDEEVKKIAEDVEKKYRIQKYDKHDQYNPDLLETIHDGKLDGEKVVLRKPVKEPRIMALNDERNIRIKQTGTVHYRNVTSTYNSYVNEYEITRTVDGEEKKDTVYTEISLLRLETKRKKNELVDPNYYECVVNKLLSEDAIEGAKRFNGGYIGLIEEEKGKLDTTIDKTKLSTDDLENLAAVMTLKERKERESNDERKEEGEAR